MTSVPLTSLTIGLPPNSTLPLADNLACDLGYYLSVGQGYVITGAAADGDTTAIGAGEVIVLLLYT